ncbi:hypothetical protein EYF80_004676 [Liparis tanakae]|uniref:Uncharacterized protein n=1 Tax=Liparis tanakae TaxID=230148 RepID=A0A4Z2J6A2_9TELE|nr:hypothetical protein EYF80_004676 [Liparis tanakae]
MEERIGCSETYKTTRGTHITRQQRVEDLPAVYMRLLYITGPVMMNASKNRLTGRWMDALDDLCSVCDAGCQYRDPLSVRGDVGSVLPDGVRLIRRRVLCDGSFGSGARVTPR